MRLASPTLPTGYHTLRRIGRGALPGAYIVLSSNVMLYRRETSSFQKLLNPTPCWPTGSLFHRGGACAAAPLGSAMESKSTRTARRTISAQLVMVPSGAMLWEWPHHKGYSGCFHTIGVSSHSETMTRFYT